MADASCPPCPRPVSYVLSSPVAPPGPHADPSSPTPPSAPSPSPLPSSSSLTSLSASLRPAHPSPSTAAAAAEDGPKDPRVWFYCSDTIVKQVSVDEVLSARAYLLFYQRVD